MSGLFPGSALLEQNCEGVSHLLRSSLRFSDINTDVQPHLALLFHSSICMYRKEGPVILPDWRAPSAEHHLSTGSKTIRAGPLVTEQNR